MHGFLQRVHFGAVDAKHFSEQNGVPFLSFRYFPFIVFLHAEQLRAKAGARENNNNSNNIFFITTPFIQKKVCF
jgi:hypothetical protein